MSFHLTYDFNLIRQLVSNYPRLVAEKERSVKSKMARWLLKVITFFECILILLFTSTTGTKWDCPLCWLLISLTQERMIRLKENQENIIWACKRLFYTKWMSKIYKNLLYNTMRINKFGYVTIFTILKCGFFIFGFYYEVSKVTLFYNLA